MTSKLKLVAGSGKISFRLLADEEIKNMGLEDLKSPLSYGRVTSLGWNFIHTKIGNLMVFSIDDAIKVNKDTYVMDERMILCRYVEDESPGGDFFKGLKE